MKSKKIIFNSRDELLRIDYSKIVYFEADGNYTQLVTVNKLRGTVGKSLSAVERFLADHVDAEDALFLRIGKRFIINMNYIYRLNMIKQQLILSDFNHFAFQVSVSKEALKKVRELILNTHI